MRFKGNILLRLNWRCMAIRRRKKNGVGFTLKNEKPPTAIAGDKETKPEPGCAGNIGTCNDSGCPMAKLPLVMCELMVRKGTADGGGNTCALDCILLTGNETDGTETCNCKSLALQN